ncbi:M15 family metallopeptidase [Arthrobacter cryoconiti]|uniref:M15 family metallopeptidase n=1 Tax=Arthrobacter cryoconiti TaxID=748907 RepID=A0ABV8R2I1_9MICC|nr:M15 family metallopeptidase [Arthrobacter cryoconiti]
MSVPESGLWDVANPESTVVLVNKHHELIPKTFIPADLTTPNVRTDSPDPPLLRKNAAAAVETMFAAAAADGVTITIQSSYRSFLTQISLYENYVEQKGQTEADKTSARPGYSEHQTGLALDIGDANVPAECEFTSCMAGSAAAKWVGAHGMEYGFIIRYPQGEEALTGYLYEPWHLRFVGISVARDMAVRGISSYEQYLGSLGAPSYK